jgi:hypothetical protein
MRTRSIRPQKRDLDLVRTVFLHRVARRDDLLGLGFFSSVARCNQRLSELVQSNWLRRVEGINGLQGHQSIYATGRAACAYLCISLDLPTEEVARHCCANEGPLFVEHALRVLDFRRRLQQVCITLGIELTEWLCEPECLHEFEYQSRSSSKWNQVCVKPDACFLVHSSGRPARFFLEVDLGHVSLPRFEGKLRRYESYLRSGAFGDAYELDRFAVLTVTVGERRLVHLTCLHCSGFKHYVTTWGQLDSEGDLGLARALTVEPWPDRANLDSIRHRGDRA